MMTFDQSEICKYVFSLIGMFGTHGTCTCRAKLCCFGAETMSLQRMLGYDFLNTPFLKILP